MGVVAGRWGEQHPATTLPLSAVMGQYIDQSNRRVRWSLILANSLSLAGCFLLIVVGIWTLVDKSFLAGLLSDRLFLSCAYIQLTAGILCLANSLFGCYAAFREVKCLLVIYSAFSCLGVTVLVMAGLMAYIFRMQVGENMKAQLVRDLHSYDPRQPDSALTSAWDNTQSKLRCCGLLTPQVDVAWHSWSHNTLVNPRMEDISQTLVPQSCCRGSSPCVVGNSTLVEEIWQGDCFAMGRLFLENHSQVMAGVTLTVAITMVGGIDLALVLFRRLR